MKNAQPGQKVRLNEFWLNEHRELFDTKINPSGVCAKQGPAYLFSEVGTCIVSDADGILVKYYPSLETFSARHHEYEIVREKLIWETVPREEIPLFDRPILATVEVVTVSDSRHGFIGNYVFSDLKSAQIAVPDWIRRGYQRCYGCEGTLGKWINERHYSILVGGVSFRITQEVVLVSGEQPEPYHPTPKVCYPDNSHAFP